MADIAEMSEFDAEQNASDGNQIKTPNTKKCPIRGIIYLSRIPKYMRVKKIRELFSVYGEVDRIFLQPDDDNVASHKKNRTFSEGWVEFTNKKYAKRVAVGLNNTQVGGKKKSVWYEETWNIKYLPKFQWRHLNEKLEYERAIHRQRLRTEVSQAKRETAFYRENIEKNAILRKLERKSAAKGEEFKQRRWQFNQTETEDEVIAKKKRKLDTTATTRKSSTTNTSNPRRAADNKSFLKHLFSGGVTAHSSSEAR